MAAMLDNLPLYTIGRRGKPNLLVTLVSKNLDGSSVELASSVILDIDLNLVKRRLIAIKKADPEGTRDCVIVQVHVSNTGKIVYDPEAPEEVDKYTAPKRDSDERNEKKLSFLEKLKRSYFK